MRCVKCEAKRKGEPEQFLFRCPGCGQEIAASNKRDGITDRAIKVAADALQGAGQYRILPEHIGYELVRRGVTKANKANKWRLAGFILLGIALFVMLKLGALILSVLIAIAGFLCLRIRLFLLDSVPKQPFRSVERFLALNPVAFLVEEGKVMHPGDAEVELVASTRQLLVCQHQRYAEYLLANDFHLTHACPVVGPEPESSNLFPGLLDRLREREGVKVFVLHDMTPAGMAFIQQVRELSQWFPDQEHASVVDLGISPGQEELVPGVSRSLTEISRAGRGKFKSGLKEGQGIELTALRPSRLMNGAASALALALPLAVLASSTGVLGRSDSGG